MTENAFIRRYAQEVLTVCNAPQKAYCPAGNFGASAVANVKKSNSSVSGRAVSLLRGG
jgi:hypothetical protein